MAVIGASNSLGGLAGSNAVARLLVVISGDSTPLTAALAKAEGTMAGFGNNASSIGKALTRNLSLPLLALGGYAVKAASDFETATARVAGLTPYLDETGKSVEQLQHQLLTLAGDPQIIAGPTELADSLFLAGSAGLDAAEVFPVVKLSAQGMSAGMGKATDISTVLIAALNNYRGSGLTAAKAMDILTVAIQEGTAAPEEMAIALGRVLPVAAAAGVSFEQVTSSVAALTNLGVPTRVATTSLRALFSELLAPTQAAKKALDAFGISAQQLRDTLANNGPVAAFELLNRAVHGNEEAIHDIIPQIRGFTAFLGLTGTNAGSYTEILNKAENATGKFKKALDLISKTPEFQFQKGLQELQIAAIEIGQDLLPIFIQLSHIFQQLGTVIGELPAPLKAALAAFIALGAVSGPVIQLYGAITKTALTTTNLASNAQILLPTVKSVAIGFAAMSIAAIAAVGGFQSLAAGSHSLISVATTLIGSFVAVKLALSGLQVAALKFGTGGIVSLVLGTASGGTFTAIAAGIAAVVTIVGLLAGQAGAAKRAAGEMGASLTDAAKAGDTLRAALKGIEDDTIHDELLHIAQAAGVMNQKVGDAFGTLSQGVGADLVTDLKKLAAGSREFVNALGGAGRTNRLIQVIEDTIAAGEDLGPALDKAGFSSEQFFNALEVAGTSTTGLAAGMGDVIDNAEVLALAYGNLFKANKDYQFAVQATIGAHLADSAAVQAMADKYGVSVDFINGKLSDFGIAAGGMSQAAQDSFIRAAAGVDKNGNKITLKMTEMQDAADALAEDLAKSLQQGFSLFGDELPKAVKNFDQVIAKAQQFGQVAVDQASNVRTLLERGVPTGLIDQFISEGPAMVAAFANATTPQLAKVVNAYDLAMGAMDASILAEAVHQEGKGKRMVEGFATSILGASNLLPGVGAKIVQAVGEGLSAGNIRPKALSLITQFVHTLNSQHNLSKAAGSQAAQAFANGVASGDFVSPKGKILVQQAARGIAANSTLTIAEAKKLVKGVAEAMEADKHKVLAAGHHVANEAVQGLGDKSSKPSGAKFVADFAAGMHQNVGLIDAAAQAMAARAKAALDAALKNSPYYFSLPMGRKTVSDFWDGVKEESKKHDPDAEDFAQITSNKFNQAFLKRIPNMLESLDKLESLIKEHMKKAFEAGDLEMAKALEQQGKHLQAHLEALQGRFADFRKGIRAGFADFRDLIGNLSDVFNEFAQANADAIAERDRLLESSNPEDIAKAGTILIPSATPGTEDIQAFLQDRLDKAKELADVLKDLAKAGLSQGVISQIAGQGENGIALGRAILAGGQDLIDQFNSTYAELRAITQKSVEQMGEKYFGKAIKFATQSLFKFSEAIVALIKELVQGLGDGNKKLIAALNSLLSNIQNAANGAGGGGGSNPPPNNNPNAPPPTLGNQWDTGWARVLNAASSRSSSYMPASKVIVEENHVHFHEPVVGNHEEFVRKIDEGLSAQRRRNRVLALDPRG